MIGEERKMIGLMRKWFNSCESVLIYSAIGSTFIMMCLTTADALGRYLFNWPIPVAYDITEKYLMPMALSLGLIYAYRSGSFIRVTFLADHLPKQVKLLVNNLVQVISTVYAVALVVTTIKRAFQAKVSGMTIASMNVPVWPAYLLIFVGLFFMTLLMLFDLRQVKAGRSHLFKEESPLS
jgi:TRAP-type C4-dicarboxylate transport system permease small subunit